jgi:hypothetical protein
MSGVVDPQEVVFPKDNVIQYARKIRQIWFIEILKVIYVKRH